MEADLKVRGKGSPLTDLDFLGHPQKGLVIQGSWAPPQPYKLKFDESKKSITYNSSVFAK